MAAPTPFGTGRAGRPPGFRMRRFTPKAVAMVGASSGEAGAARLRGNGLALLSTLLWATAFPATSTLLLTWGALPAAVARVGVAALVLLALLVLSGGLAWLGPVPWRRVVTLGIPGFAGGAGLLVAGQALSNPVTTAIIATSFPLISAAMGLLAGEGRPGPALLLGLVLAVGGGTLATLAAAEGDLGLRGGEILVLASQVCWAWFSRRAVVEFAGWPPLARAALPMAAGAIFLVTVMAALHVTGLAEVRASLDRQSLLLCLWIGGVGIAASVTLWLTASRLLGVTVAGLHLNLGPFYVMLILLPLGGQLVTAQVVGAVLVAAGAAVAQLQPGAYGRWRGRAGAVSPPVG